jgi:hypothetical protein
MSLSHWVKWYKPGFYAQILQEYVVPSLQAEPTNFGTIQLLSSVIQMFISGGHKNPTFCIFLLQSQAIFQLWVLTLD